MTVPESFPAFLATQRDDAVDRGVATLARDDLGDGEVTVRVDWSSVNYKDALATIPKGQVARISPLVPGIDLAGEVVGLRRATRSPPATRSSSPATTSASPTTAARRATPASPPTGSWRCPTASRPARRWPSARPGSRRACRSTRSRPTASRPADGPVLVPGASGGVGSTAVGALAAAGYEVWAATGKAAEHDYLRGLGAHEIVTREETTAESDRPLEKMRWAAAVDPVGGAATAYALRTTRYGGAVAVSGLTGGTDAQDHRAALHPAQRQPARHRLRGRRRRRCAARCGRAWPATCARAASTRRSRARSTSTASSPSSTRCWPARRSGAPWSAFPRTER